MGIQDQRDFVIFYGIKQNDWESSFGKFRYHKEELVMSYINIDADCSEYTQATSCTNSLYCVTVEFLFPHHIKKQYYIEGVIEGEFAVACNGGNSQINDFRVSIWKTNENSTFERLAVTDLSGSEWITLNDTLTWDGGNSIGEEKVYHWRIDCWNAKELKEEDRFYLQIEIRGTNDKLYLLHSNDPDWTDIWVKIPFRL